MFFLDESNVRSRCKRFKFFIACIWNLGLLLNRKEVLHVEFYRSQALLPNFVLLSQKFL